MPTFKYAKHDFHKSKSDFKRLLVASARGLLIRDRQHEALALLNKLLDVMADWENETYSGFEELLEVEFKPAHFRGDGCENCGGPND